jgi:hypothetical protein
VRFSSGISLLNFCLDDLSIGDRGVLRSPTTTVLESIYAIRSFRVCLMKLGTLTLCAYRLVIVISFWCISPFISMEFDQRKFEVYFVWISITTPACFQGPLSW